MERTSARISFGELMDLWHGPVGTPKRDRADRAAARYSEAIRLSEMAMSMWPEYMRVFWGTIVRDRTLHPRAFLDVMSFSYLGDFLFHGRPITQTYADSWASRVHLPRWLRVRRGY